MTQTNQSLVDAISKVFEGRDAVSDIAHGAYQRFERQGLPHRRVEGWRWSDFRAVLREAQSPAASNPSVPIAPSIFADRNPIEFRIIDGQIIQPDDIEPGMKVNTLGATAIVPDLEMNPIGSLNVAMAQKSAAVDIGAGSVIQRPILIRHIHNSSGFVFVQSLVRVREGASATVIETFEGAGKGFYSYLAQSDLRENAQLKRYVLTDCEDQAARHVLMSMKQEKKSRFFQTSLSTGSVLSREELFTRHMGQQAETYLDSAALLAGTHHADMTTTVKFNAPGGKVRQRHKGVAANRGRNIFQGKFEVTRPAQKTDAKMTANAMLLSDTAEANHKPELEIYADDVECAHGSTAGALDDDALFYLRQRGLDEQTARSLLIEAFVGEVIDDIADDRARSVFQTKVEAWLAAL